jgi:hypothetical protein
MMLLARFAPSIVAAAICEPIIIPVMSPAATASVATPGVFSADAVVILPSADAATATNLLCVCESSQQFWSIVVGSGHLFGVDCNNLTIGNGVKVATNASKLCVKGEPILICTRLISFCSTGTQVGDYFHLVSQSLGFA